MNKTELKSWLANAPKAELHLHIDGSLQASRMLSLAQKNDISLPYKTEAEVLAAYDFSDLQSFLDLYYLGASVLKDEQDFYHLMMDYLLKCKEQNVIHTEIMVEPQTYAPAGVSFATMMNGFKKAIDDAKAQWGQSVGLILSFLRHLSEEEALATLKEAEPFKDQFVAIGLASSEKGNPPAKFVNLYREAISQGYLTVAHAGEEGPADYIWASLNDLNVSRIDHGVRCVEDAELVEHLVKTRMPLTVCPLSNVRLCVFDKLADHNILDLLAKDVAVTVNSDDPAYFGGYMNENFLAMADELDLTFDQAYKLIANSFEASFVSDDVKQGFMQKLDASCV